MLGKYSYSTNERVIVEYTGVLSVGGERDWLRVDII